MVCAAVPAMPAISPTYRPPALHGSMPATRGAPPSSSTPSGSTIDVSVFFFSSRRRHTRFDCDWSSDVCSSDLSCAVWAIVSRRSFSSRTSNRCATGSTASFAFPTTPRLVRASCATIPPPWDHPMRARLPEARVTGPEPAVERDIEGLNRVFAEAFTERCRRDGLIGVRVPQLNPLVWRYALLDAGEGAMVWRDEHGDIAAFNVAHQAGVEGWMGPLAVRPDRQGTGVGKTIVRTAADWLIDRGVTTLGLETMPRTPENIGFYARLGFTPGFLTVTPTNRIATRGPPAPVLLSNPSAEDKETTMAAARRLVDDLVPGVDFAREIMLTAELGLGDTSLVEGDTGLDAMAVWHSAPLADSRTRDEVRVLKLAARGDAAFDAAIGAVEAAAAKAGIRRIAIRCQSRYAEAFRRLVARGYRVRWTDLRMTYEGYPERHAAQGVLFSNWEI